MFCITLPIITNNNTATVKNGQSRTPVPTKYDEEILYIVKATGAIHSVVNRNKEQAR